MTLARKSNSVTREEARRIALAAQGMASSSRRNTTATWTRIAAAIDTMNLLQIDSVNVVARSHYMPVLARVGHYRAKTLDDRAFVRRKQTMFEYWAHEASLLPMRFYPLLRWRMARAANHDGIYKEMVTLASERPDYIDLVRKEVSARGPLRASDLPEAVKTTKEWWSWSTSKTALEYLFATGEITAAGREGNFERLYDIPERVIAPEYLNAPIPTEADAIRELLDLSARALGIASQADLRDYFRLPLKETRRGIDELVEAGRLQPVEAEGWRHQAYLHTDAELPSRATGTAFLSPFDPLVWNRDRAERIFGFSYKIEIYTPATKRKYGYYVLPLLLNGRLVGRSCLKSDRQNGVLRVNACHVEPGADPEATAIGKARALHRLSDWLDLPEIDIADSGNLAGQLRKSLSVET